MRGPHTIQPSFSHTISVILGVTVFLLSFVLSTAVYRKYQASKKNDKQLIIVYKPDKRVRKKLPPGLTVRSLLTAVSGPKAYHLYTRLFHFCEASDSRCRRLLKNPYVAFAYALFQMDHENMSVQEEGLKRLKKVREGYRVFGLFPSSLLGDPSMWGSSTEDLVGSRRGQRTRLHLCHPDGKRPLYQPPRHLFQVAYYPSSVGYLPAYFYVPTGARVRGSKFPAILWAHRGSTGLSPSIWEPSSPVYALLRQGFVVMVPTWRGEHNNPGEYEYFFGEVDDAIHAIRYLSRLSYVDASRVYMMGHREGGTITMLAAQSTKLLRAAFSLSGQPRVTSKHLKHAVARCASSLKRGKAPFLSQRRLEMEGQWRSAIHFLSAFSSPMFFFAETYDRTLSHFVRMIRKRIRLSKNPNVLSYFVSKGSYPDYAQILVKHILTQLKNDKGASAKIQFSWLGMKRLARRSFRRETKQLWRSIRSKRKHKRWWAADKLVRLSFANAPLQGQLQAFLREASDEPTKWIMLRTLLQHPAQYLRKQAMDELAQPLQEYWKKTQEQGRRDVEKTDDYHLGVHSLSAARFSSFEDVSRWSTLWMTRLENVSNPTVVHTQTVSKRSEQNNPKVMNQRILKAREIIWKKVASFQRIQAFEMERRRRYVAAYFLSYYATKWGNSLAKDYVNEALIQHADDNIKNGIYWGYLIFGAPSQRELAFAYYGRKARENVHKKYNPFYCAIRHSVEKLKDPALQAQAKFALLSIRNNTLFRTYLNRPCPYVEISWADVE